MFEVFVLADNTRENQFMFTLEKSFTFEASHQLPNHDGKCKRLHGHSWKMAVILKGHALQATGPQQGMLADYGRISAIVKPLVEEKLDHYHLNDTTGLVNPTSEELARWVYDQLKARIHLAFGIEYVNLHSVRIEETCTSACTYCPKET